jgi:hypothetical protein
MSPDVPSPQPHAYQNRTNTPVPRLYVLAKGSTGISYTLDAPSIFLPPPKEGQTATQLYACKPDLRLGIRFHSWLRKSDRIGNMTHVEQLSIMPYALMHECLNKL